MKRIVMYALFCLLSVTSLAISGGHKTEKIYYDNKMLESSIDYINNKKNGMAEVFSRDGLLTVRGSFRNDARHGLWTFYYEGTNTLQAVEFYENNRLQGKQSYYYPNGKLKNIACYKDDRRIGKWEWYDENGVLETVVSYSSNNNGIASMYDENGNVTSKGPVTDEIRNGMWEFYDTKGKLMYKMNYQNGEPYGSYEAYDIDGKVLLKGVIDTEGNMDVNVDEIVNENSKNEENGSDTVDNNTPSDPNKIMDGPRGDTTPIKNEEKEIPVN